MNSYRLPVCLLMLLIVMGPVRLGAAQANQVVWLSSLDLTKMTSGRGVPQANQSVALTPLRIAGRSFSQEVPSGLI